MAEEAPTARDKQVLVMRHFDAALRTRLRALVSDDELCGNMGDAVIRRRSVLAYW